MFRSLRTLFLTRRTFLIGWSLAVLFVLGWVWPWLFVWTKLIFLFFVLAICADLFLLYGRRSGMKGTRRTLERWSNGDNNPVTDVLLCKVRQHGAQRQGANSNNSNAKRRFVQGAVHVVFHTPNRVMSCTGTLRPVAAAVSAAARIAITCSAARAPITGSRPV